MMMIHAALSWVEHNEKYLWYLALIHAVHLHNKTPHIDTHLTPRELWSRFKSSYNAVVQVHPWGCPVYVLQPWLHDGGKVTK